MRVLLKVVSVGLAALSLVTLNSVHQWDASQRPDSGTAIIKSSTATPNDDLTTKKLSVFA
ncbi:hypothetical protein D3C87_1565710 [compost metagenome]